LTGRFGAEAGSGFRGATTFFGAQEDAGKNPDIAVCLEPGPNAAGLLARGGVTGHEVKGERLLFAHSLAFAIVR
jgi:hypothetical protein